MRKFMISLLAGVSVLSLVACTPKRYERQANRNSSSSSVKREEGYRSKYYQEALDRYKSYAVAFILRTKQLYKMN